MLSGAGVVANPGGAPNGPYGLTVVAAGPSAAQLSFYDNAGNETGFVVERATGAGGAFVTVQTVAASPGVGQVVTVNDGGLSAGQTYAYRVYAVNGATYVSSIAGPVGVTLPVIEGAGVPAAPVARTVTTSGAGVSPASVTLEFTDMSDNETGFVLERSTSLSAAFTPVATLGAQAGFGLYTITDTTPVAGVTYDYRIYAVNGALQSDRTDVRQATVPLGTTNPGGAPNGPYGLTARATGPNAVQLQFYDNANNETGFSVRRTSDGGTSEVGALPPSVGVGGVVTFADTTVVPGKGYTYKVFARNGAYESSVAGPVWVDTPTDAGGVKPAPFGGSPAVLPGRVEAENFDVGGEGIGYHDSDAANLGKQYRPSEGVDVETGGSGFDVGWTHAGEYLGYTVNVATAGTYTFNARVANVGSGASFHVEVDGANVSGPIAVPDTGAFQNYTTVSKGGISLAAGPHVVRLVMDASTAYGFAGNFDWFEFASSTTPGGGVGSISGTVFNDTQTNGRLDGSESGIAGRVVYLDIGGFGTFREGDPIATTDANGQYAFTGLTPANYIVRLMPAAGTVIERPAWGGFYFERLGQNPTATGQDFALLNVAEHPSATERDGKLVLGVKLRDVVPFAGTDGVMRFNTDGTADPTYGVNGFAKVTSYDTFESGVSGLAFRQDGQLLVLTGDFTGTDLSVLNGSGAEVHTAVVPGGNYAAKYAMLFGSKVIIATSSYFSAPKTLVRYDANLNLDTSFGGTGIVTVPGFESATVTGLVVLANGDYQVTYDTNGTVVTKTVTAEGVVL